MKTYLFPGQGSQYIGMGASLFDTFPELTLIADKILGYSIKELCLKDSNNQLAITKYTQPALYVVNALSYRQCLREQKNTTPDFTAGHSLGEYNALESANMISFEDGLQLVKKRGELMGDAPRGTMAAIIGLTAETVQKILLDNELLTVDIANYNSKTQIVISGIESDIHRAQLVFEKYKAMYIPLNVTGAFHSRYMQIAYDEFKKFLVNFKFSEPVFPVIANINARPYSCNQARENLTNQLIHSVRWLDSIEFLLAQGVTKFIEVGPGDVLSKLVDNIRDQYFFNKSKQQDKTMQIASSQVISSEDKINDWNRLYKIGTKVNAKGYEQILETRTEAMVLFGHRAVVYLNGYNGYFALDDIQPITG